MDTNIFIHEHKQTNQTSEDQFFGLLVNQDFIDKDNNPRINNESSKHTLAKIKYKANNIPRYLVRIDETKKIFNPLSPLPENKSIKLLHSISSDTHLFKEVNKKCFDFYLTFLKTSNTSWILNAEREDL
jgi:hypothetical protein